LTTWKTPPVTGEGEARQNSGAEASPIGKGSASRHIRRRLITLIALFAHFYLENLPTPGKMIKLIA
jgi:hypothetical protein